MHVHITATLSAEFGMPDPEREVPTFQFALNPVQEDAVCDEVYAILNSYPGEMHCADTETNRAIVAAYRGRRLRSLSVGDTITLDRDGATHTYRVASFGWDEV